MPDEIEAPEGAWPWEVDPSIEEAKPPEPLTPIDAFRIPRIHDPKHPLADANGTRPAHPREFAQARLQEAQGGNQQADTDHNVHEW